MPHREPFDINRPLVAARGFTFAGTQYQKGDPFPGPNSGIRSASPNRLIERQYNTGAVIYGKDKAADSPVQMTGPAGGRYTITAPWMDTPLVVRGKVKAEAALKDLQDEGAPLGWIDGGTETEIEEVGGGWYAITAPWLEEPIKVQGRDEAEAAQRELHDSQPAQDATEDENATEGPDANTAKSDNEKGPTGAPENESPNSAGETDNGAEIVASGENGDEGAEAGKTNDGPATA